MVEHGREEEKLIHNLKQEINQLEKILDRKFKLPEDENPRVLEVQESAESIEEKTSGEHVDKTPSPPRQIHSSDKILLLRDKILVLPHDIEGKESDDTENVFYTKVDSKRLEKFLLEEAAGVWKRPEKKCHKCDIRCEVCDLMNREGTKRM